MKADARWENQAKHVIRFTFAGDWNWEDFYGVFDRRDPYPPDQRICFLIDIRAVTRIPSDAVLHMRRFVKLAEQVGGLIIIIATSVPAMMMFRLFVSVYRSASDKFRLVANDEEAYAILQMPA